MLEALSSSGQRALASVVFVCKCVRTCEGAISEELGKAYRDVMGFGGMKGRMMMGGDDG